ncbi:MAG: glycosyltransferase [Ignavibacteriaceae bacterium]
MISNKLLDEYNRINPAFKKLYIVPLINYHIKNSDYLYLLYKPILENKSVEIINLSAASHYKLLGAGIKESILHYHWFEVTDIKSLLGIIWKTFWITLYKILGGKIIWTIHNKFPHAGKYITINKILRKYLADLSSKLHVHCASAAGIMSPVLNVDKNKFFIVEHPYYPAKLMGKADAVTALISGYPEIKIEESQKVFLSFGTIAEYKGLTELIAIFKSKFNRHLLIIAGPVKKVNQEYYKQLIAASKGNRNIIVLGKIIPDEDVPYFFNSSDAVVFNYRDILTSGGVILALSYNKTTIAPSLGCLNEIKDKNLVLFKKDGSGSVNLQDTLLKLAEKK